jgi:hypothetical protein
MFPPADNKQSKVGKKIKYKNLAEIFLKIGRTIPKMWQKFLV